MPATGRRDGPIPVARAPVSRVAARLPVRLRAVAVGAGRSYTRRLAWKDSRKAAKVPASIAARMSAISFW
jgi:hypothetical protein